MVAVREGQSWGVYFLFCLVLEILHLSSGKNRPVYASDTGISLQGKKKNELMWIPLISISLTLLISLRLCFIGAG